MTPAARRRVWWCAFLALYTLEQALLLWLYWGHGAKTLAGDEVKSILLALHGLYCGERGDE